MQKLSTKDDDTNLWLDLLLELIYNKCILFLASPVNYSDYAITEIELQKYQKGKTVSEKMREIWKDLVDRIEDPEIKKEAAKKGFELVDNPDMEDDIIAYYLMFIVPNASEKLHNYLIENLYPFLVCIKEDDE